MNRKKKIAIFSTGWCGEILSQFLNGMQKALTNEPVDLFLFLSYITHSDSSEARKGDTNIFQLPNLHDFDGVVIFGSGLDFKEYVDDIIKRAKDANIPIIMQGRRREGTYFVGSDNYQATQDMVKHLMTEHGVKKIHFFAGSNDSYDSELRLKAIKDYLEEINQSEVLCDVYYTNWSNLEANRRISDLCSSGEELPDAFICANDGLAMETCSTLNAYGYKVPEDIKVTGYDYIDDGQIFYPSIASIDQCFTEMGEETAKLWINLNEGVEEDASYIIPCRFIPGDSCGCFAFRNSDEVRRQNGRDNFARRAGTTYFNWKLDVIDTVTLSSGNYQDFKNNLLNLFVRNHAFEGESYHILLDPAFGASIYDQSVILKSEGYSEFVEVIYSMEDGKQYDGNLFESKKLIPGYTGEGANHLYVFLSLYEMGEIYGYMVFRDAVENINNKFLYMYQNRVRTVFDKFKRIVTLNLINKKLMDLMQRDSLTNVRNRMAYDDKEKQLQSQIDAGNLLSFAIIMFDINNLKLVNDSKGHDAGDGYLIRSCRLICNIFKHSPVYRVGGDEFIAILIGDDYDHRNALVKDLKENLSPYTDSLPLPINYVSIACGMAVYIPGKDITVGDVVKRADEEMYRNKSEIKGEV